MLHFKPSLDAFSLRFDVTRAMKILQNYEDFAAKQLPVEWNTV
jgi:hypothetical protein